MNKSYMVNKKKILLACLFFVIAITGSLFPCFFQDVAHAETFVEQTVSDGYFSVSMSANSRKNGVLQRDERTATNLLGQEVNFLCFKWSQLQNLRFRITSTIDRQSFNFSEFSFLLTSVQADDLSIPLTQATLNYKPTTETLYHTNITQNKFTAIDFQYYVDSTADINENLTRCRGNDFGLYKFDFQYTYSDGEASHTISFGDIYVAVLPDDVDEVTNSTNLKDVKIFYSVTSSNKLMNVFNLYLSTDAYRYVNPSYLQWNVEGKDLDNYEYVLTQKIKDEKPGEYASHQAIWPSLASTCGTSFVFDSNDIEGTWTAYCTIKTNNPQKNDYVLKSDTLSTVKQEQPSYLWLILTIVGIILAICLVVGIIVFIKKRDKVW